MPPDFLITEFQALWRPLAPLLRGVNILWGAGAATLEAGFFNPQGDLLSR